MTRWLLGVVAVAIAIAVILALGGRGGPGSQAGMDSGSSPAIAPEGPGNEPTTAGPMPSYAEILGPSGDPGEDARAPATAGSIAEPDLVLVMSGMPIHGTTRIQFASTLGGQAVHGRLAAAWRRVAVDRIALRVDRRSATASLVRGVWTLEAPDLGIVERTLAVEIARSLALLASGLAEPATRPLDSTITAGGTPWRVTTRRDQEVVWSALSTDPDTRLDPPNVEEIRVQTDRHGGWLGAEHRRGSPSRSDAPGFLAQRVVIVPGPASP